MPPSHFIERKCNSPATQINNNQLAADDVYKYTNRVCGNVNNSYIRKFEKEQKINPYLNGLGLSYSDMVFFSRYSEYVLGEAIDKLKYLRMRYEVRNPGAYLNVACRRIVEQRRRNL